MVSKSGISSSESTNSQEEQRRDVMANLSYKLNLLKRKIQSERVVSVGEKLEKNSKRIQAYASELETLTASRADFTDIRSNDSVNLLSLRMDNPLCKVGGLIQSPADRDGVSSEDFIFSSTAKLPKLTQTMPPYTTWIFLDRNQRMADDQSVAGRRRIYYAVHGGEALLCSDSEEDLAQLEGKKHIFSEGEDRIIREVSQEYGITNEVLDTLTQFIEGTCLEIQERCNILKEKDQIVEKQKLKSSVEEKSEDNIFLDKSLGAALDSLDNLFCRRCLVFDCRLHGCSQNLIYPTENQTHPSDPGDRKPCGSQCYLQLNDPKNLPSGPPVDPSNRAQSKASDKEERTAFSSYDSEQAHNLENKVKLRAPKFVSDDLRSSSSKKLNLAEFSGSNECEVQISTDDSVYTLQIHNVDELDVTGTKVEISLSGKEEDEGELSLNQASNPLVKHTHGRSEWRSFEKDLYLKGLEIFGRNSCFIARNLLSGLKTCKEVSSYMYGDGVFFPHGSSTILSSLFEDGGKSEMENMGPDMPMKPRMCRKRGRTRKIKSSWKSAGHPSLWRRVADGKDEPYKQYVPCGCESSCGKQCSCLQIGTCCEKYCGCSKGCKNRFRGCHCAKSQCKSRQCPCFAAGRECDPDVCRNCWVSCGDGSLGEPPRRGEGQCGNMKLLLRQQQRILLAKSDIAGWGAFLKNSVNKNDYLGEYTGELISHQEADRRGKIYDRVNSSFLFDLNDQYVLDAYRKGDKLKFANHSSTPNCYAKVMLVAGDHRVGIFANECIEAGEELFYDYRYGPDQAPAWARKPEGSKRDGSPITQGRRAKKHQSSG